MDGTPIWRTRLWPLLIAWMGLVAAAPFGIWPLAEQLPTAPVGLLLAVLFTVAPLVLLIWALVVMMREPVSGWIAPAMLLGFAGAMVPAAQPLIDAGRRVNFESHRSAYEALIADAKAGRLGGRALGGDWVEGRRDGVHYRYKTTDPTFMEFLWLDDGLYYGGVNYDETPCRPQPGLRCVSRGVKIDGYYSWFEGIV